MAQRLLDSIEQGEIAPGQRLSPDRVIATEQKVSRATVREALLALELLGVVEIRHGSGVYVLDQSAMAGSSMDQASFQPSTTALFEARAAVEPKIAQLCATRMTAAQIDKAEASMDLARAAIRDNVPYPEFSDLQIAFHLQLLTACASPVLADIGKRLISVDEHPLWALLNQHAVRTQDQRLQQVAEHAAVLERIKARDPEGAEQAMRSHVCDLGDLLQGKK